ncbi:PREDICTED: putative CCA tRNA nucleotidyltransferase 2 [Tarenaya hassleriana]|uniref:putative CCA tRNA nucleotidyltransferase 2 n=1 Tax=Tarenaya hassleriana TaxID=28532 RepID=UPI00053C7291|nr:PREDICTED: putative CCA tRNA nucleotidyltransferase 2 [Tarenaya hassleriana]
MRLSLPLNTVINLRNPLPLLSRHCSLGRRPLVSFRNFSILSVAAAPRHLHCYWPPATMTAGKVMSTTTVEGEKKQPPVSVEVKDRIDLTETERKIFDRLLATARYFNFDTQLRVAGGWVRDKLLGKDCDDIDIAIDNMLGSEFLDKVCLYLSSTGETVQGKAVIERNPEQSKHLETARMRLFDLWIDFVNLRCEEYTENSRIPVMKFGSAKEDAYRRDLTINSLFYNINTGLIEDFTERGIDDLESGRIVTPLPARATFLDDPLRVLRAIRFGARFGFALDKELKEAASSEEVKIALGQKISRERIGHEIDLMISGNRPVAAATYIHDLKLFFVVFALPSSPDPAPLENCENLCLAGVDGSWKLIQSIGYSKFSNEQRRLALYAALFLPFRKTFYKDSKGKRIPVVNHIFKDSLKLKTSDSETVINIHRAAERFLKLIPSLQLKKDVRLDELDWAVDVLEHWKSISLHDPELPETSKVRVLTGFVLREIKDFWRVSLVTSLLLHTEDRRAADMDIQLDEKREMYLTIQDTILELGLEKIWDVKPLVNGKEIMNVLQLKSGGPLIREWQQKLVTWQLAYPSGKADECIDWMKETNAKRIRTE